MESIQNNLTICTPLSKYEEQAIIEYSTRNNTLPSEFEEQGIMEDHNENCTLSPKCVHNPREERFKKYKIKCNTLIKYLKDGYLKGMSANQIRQIRYQAKRHIFDPKSEYVLSILL